MNADFSDRTYTVEVMRTSTDPARAIKCILALTHAPTDEGEISEGGNPSVKIIHSYLASDRAHHRTSRITTLPSGEKISLPRQLSRRGKVQFLYDVLIAQRDHHIVVAVPFHQLAEDFFLQVDRELAGTRTVYERLDITKMVIELGSAGTTTMPDGDDGRTASLTVTRCHLAYAEREGGNGSLRQVQITGANIGTSQEYQTLVGPVLRPSHTGLNVTPIVLGFALSSNGVRKSSATTDRHGNFKLWIAPGLRRLTRIFKLLAAIEMMGNVASTTSNVPILQSKNIRDTEE